MANKWQLNDARQIAYFDANGDKQSAKAVWYIGQYNKYKVWPGTIYLTDVQIEGGGQTFDYSITNQGVPSYKALNGTTYSGLSPDTDYVVKGTIVVYQAKDGENKKVASYENCYPWYLTLDDYKGSGSSGSIWTGTNANDTKPNPILPEGDPQKNWRYNTFRCSTAVVTSNGTDDNAWISGHMGYITKWPGDDNGFTTITKLGESDFGIRLKRAKRKHTWTPGTQNKSKMIYGDEATIQGTSYITGWDGPKNQDVSSGYSATSSDSSVLSVQAGSSNTIVRCIKEIEGERDITVTLKSNSVAGLTQQSKTYTFTVYGIVYSATLNSITNYSVNSTATVTLTGTHNLVLKKSKDYLYISKNNTGGLTPTWEEVSCTLTSDNSSVASVSSQQVTMRGEGTTNINVKVGGVTVMTIPVKVEAPKTIYFRVSPSLNTNVMSVSGDTRIGISREQLQNNTYMGSVSFYGNSGGTSLVNVYYTTSGTYPSSMSSSMTTSTISLYITDSTSREWTYTIYDKQGGTKLGTITIDYI